MPVGDPFEVLGTIVARVAVDVVDLRSDKVCVCMPSHRNEPVNVERIAVYLCRDVMRLAVQSHERLRQELRRQYFADTPPITMAVTVRALDRMRPLSEASYIGRPGMVRQFILPQTRHI